jgi:hypothetical protein
VWSIDNGTLDGQTAAAAQFTAGVPGTTTLTLTATNAAGDSATSTKTVTVLAPPTPCAIAAVTPVTVSKTGLVASTPALVGHTYSWLISDGAITAGSANASMSYTAAAAPTTATITCRATNAAGDFTDAQLAVSVIAAAASCGTITAFSSVTVSRAGLPAGVAAQTGVTFDWTVGGASVASAAANAITYTAPAAPGAFDVGCSACNAAGDCVAPTVRTITANAKGLVLLWGATGVTGQADGNISTARFNSPRGLSYAGNTLFIADYGNKCIRHQQTFTTNAVQTLSGIDCTPGSTTLAGPQGVAARVVTGSKFETFIADSEGHCIWQQYSTNPAVVVAGQCGSQGTANDATGTNARFRFPTDIVLDEARGYAYIAEYGNSAVRRMGLTPPYAVETIVGLAGTNASGPYGTFATPIPGANVRAFTLHGVALSRDGNTLIAVQNGTNVLFTDLTSPTFLTYLAGVPSGFHRHVAVDFGGTVFVTPTPSDVIKTIAGVTIAGSGTGSPMTLPAGLFGNFDDPDGIAVDPQNGDLIVSSSTQHVIVRVRH